MTQFRIDPKTRRLILNDLTPPIRGSIADLVYYAVSDADTQREQRDLLNNLTWLNEKLELLMGITPAVKFVDKDSNIRTFDELSAPNDFLLEVGRDNLTGISHINKFGRNPDCAQAASATAVNIGRSIWDGGIAGAVNWLAPTAARIHQVKSTDNDDGAGTNAGARTVEIFGLNAAYVLSSEIVALNGTTDVATLDTYTMIYRIIVRTAGATGYNEGDITATADSDGTVTAKITAKNNQTLMAIYMIPDKTEGFMTHYYASIHKSGGATKFADMFLMSKRLGEVWRLRDVVDVSSDGAAFVPREFTPYKTFEAKELVQMVANPSADAQDISAGFDLILVKK